MRLDKFLLTNIPALKENPGLISEDTGTGAPAALLLGLDRRTI